LSSPQPPPPPPPPVANPDSEVRSSRRVHNMALYCPARPDHRIRIHHWPPPPLLLHYMTRNRTWVCVTGRSLIYVICSMKNLSGSLGIWTWFNTVHLM
jgi:hypothetical protein